MKYYESNSIFADAKAWSIAFLYLYIALLIALKCYKVKLVHQKKKRTDEEMVKRERQRAL